MPVPSSNRARWTSLPDGKAKAPLEIRHRCTEWIPASAASEARSGECGHSLSCSSMRPSHFDRVGCSRHRSLSHAASNSVNATSQLA
jgi:hypothetical protein